MPRRCQVTGKVPVRGNRYAIRGIAKKKKGIGLKITGIKKRRFNINITKKRFWLPKENRFISLKVTAHAMRIIDRLGIDTVVQQMRKRGESF